MNRFLVALSCVACALAALAAHAADDKKAPAPKAALSVLAVQPQSSTLALKITANGSIAAWQEASVGSEANGLRLAEVRVNVGDVVKRGQVLAVFAADPVKADLAQANAAAAEAEAALVAASADAKRARDLQSSGAFSKQQIEQYIAAERTALARMDAQRAVVASQQLRLTHTKVLAPDNGVISSRSATVGAVLPAGQELFRLIRQGRLEWRAEVPAGDLARLKPGVAASVAATTGASAVVGKVRMVAPTVDPQTRNGIVYVDLVPSPAAKAGMFARGEFDVGQSTALTLPQGAVLLRDGFNYVLRIGADSKVAQAKVLVGRRIGDRVEILSGVEPDVRVVATGGGFLSEGDTVRVVDPAAPGAASAAAPAPAPKAK